MNQGYISFCGSVLVGSPVWIGSKLFFCVRTRWGEPFSLSISPSFLSEEHNKMEPYATGHCICLWTCLLFFRDNSPIKARTSCSLLAPCHIALLDTCIQSVLNRCVRRMRMNILTACVIWTHSTTTLLFQDARATNIPLIYEDVTVFLATTFPKSRNIELLGLSVCWHQLSSLKASPPQRAERSVIIRKIRTFIL